MKKKRLFTTLFTAVLLTVTIVLFHDSIGPVLTELQRTSAAVVLAITVCSFWYNLMEGWSYSGMARAWNPDITVLEGLDCSLYSGFYRTVTFGSGSAIATTCYLSRKKVPASASLGIATVQYILHKMAVALAAGICFLENYSFMKQNFGEYVGFLWLGFLMTVIIAAVLLLLCICEPLHRSILRLLAWLDKRQRWKEKRGQAAEQLRLLKENTEGLWKRPVLILPALGKQMLKLTGWYTIPWFLFEKGTGTSYGEIAAVTALMTALAGVVPTPAGIGSVEALFVLFFGKITGSIEAASAMILYRFSTYLLPFLEGAAVNGGKRLWQKVKSRN